MSAGHAIGRKIEQVPQGFVIRGIGFRQSILRRNNPEPLMSVMGQKQT
jgi:hypothetical protein